MHKKTIRKEAWNLILLGWLEANFHIWTHWPKIEKNNHKLRSFDLLGVLNTLLAFCYSGETDFDKTLYISQISDKVKLCQW